MHSGNPVISQITLSEEITSYIALWEAKIAVLEVAFDVLAGKKNLSGLDKAMASHPRWNEGKDRYTVALVGRVKEISCSLAIIDKPPQLPCVNHDFSARALHPDIFSQLPGDIILLLLFGYVGNGADIVNFARTSRKNHHCLFYTNHSRMFPQMLHHAALAEWNAVGKIWAEDYEFLLKRGTVSHDGRYLYQNKTAGQIAMMNDEWGFVIGENEINKTGIVERINACLTPKEQKKQFDEIFPDGKIICHAWDLEEAKQLLLNVYAAIIKDDVITENNLDQMSDETRAALKVFFEYIHPDKFNACQKGLVFDVQIYQEALKQYENNFDAFVKWDKRTFWCVRVEEAIAYLLPTGYLRPHCQGIYKIVSEGEKLKADGCKLSQGTAYFKRVPNFLPGVHFFVNIHGADGNFGGEWRGVNGRCSFLENLCQAKTSSLQDLCERSQKRVGA